MNTLPLPFNAPGPAALAAGPVAGAARSARYLETCQRHGEDPSRLVLQVTDGRTGDPAALTGPEMDALLEAWLARHEPRCATTGASESTTSARLCLTVTPTQAPAPEQPHQSLQLPLEAALGRADPETPRRGAVAQLDGAVDDLPTASHGCPAAPAAPDLPSAPDGPAAPAAVPEATERYVVAVADVLLTELRVHAARRGQQMGRIVAAAVEDMLLAVQDGQDPPGLDPRWRVPSSRRSRLAMSWPGGLADRLRDVAASSGRPAHELVGVALTARLLPDRGRRR